MLEEQKHCLWRWCLWCIELVINRGGCCDGAKGGGGDGGGYCGGISPQTSWHNITHYFGPQ